MLTRGIYQLQKTLGLGSKYYKEEDTEHDIVITIAVPGAQSTKAFRITMSRDMLKIVFEGNDFCDSFLYVYPLPKNARKLDAMATLEDGILTMVIPKN